MRIIKTLFKTEIEISLQELENIYTLPKHLGEAIISFFIRFFN